MNIMSCPVIKPVVAETYHIVERGRLSEVEARYIFKQIISAVKFYHFKRVEHQDLKPENLLMDSKGNFKLVDFGLSNVMRDGHFLKTSCGSPNSNAPEILSDKHYSGPEVDVWSCGVILYVLLCRNHPLDAEIISILFKIIKDRLYTLPSHLSPGARDLIYWILLVDPMRRVDIFGIRKHPWFQSQLPPRLLVSPAEIKARANKECGTSNLFQTENKLTMTEDSLQEQSYPHKTRTSSILQASGRRNWTLGLQSQARPNDKMREVFIVFESLNISWM